MSPDDFRRLVALGLNSEQIAVVMEMMERDARAYAEAEEARKAKGRERVARWREARNVTETQPNVTERLTGGSVRVEDKTSKPQIEPQEENKKREHALASFAEFWSVYPNKTGKPVAERAYLKAIRKTPPAAILAGLRRYLASKPADRPWLNPSTFLNQERWADEPANVVPLGRPPPPPFGMDAFLGAVIEHQERSDEGPDAEVESYPPAARLVR